MVKSRQAWIQVGTLSLCLLARAGESTPAPRQVAPPKRIPDVVPGATLDIPQNPGQPVTTASMPRAVRQAVAADAARRFQVAEDAVVLASAELVTWSDGSLGCPKPGLVYTQMLVQGYRVMATSAAGQLLYHTDTRGNVVTCGMPPRPAREPQGKPPDR